MFQVGDYVIGNTNYCYTNEEALCKVLQVLPSKEIVVRILAHNEFVHVLDRSHEYKVDEKDFTNTTPEEYFTKFPFANKSEELNKIKNDITKEKTDMETRMIKGSYELTQEERKNLRDEIIKLLIEYNYNPTEYGVNKIIDEWVKNKGWMIELFKKHPNYNGKYQIVFDADYDRKFDADAIHSFGTYCETISRSNLKELVIGKHRYKEVLQIYCKLAKIHSCMHDCSTRGYHMLANGKDIKEIEKEFALWKKRYDEYANSDKTMIIAEIPYDKETYLVGENLYQLFRKLKTVDSAFANDEIAQFINKLFPDAKATARQKISRIVNKICNKLGIDKDPNYNREYAKFADAINPLAIKRHTILSCHPVDYLTMSFGNSWASCHTIDKTNKRGMPDSYSGCYSSGTLSYMLDESSFVFYTVDNSYKGNEYELQDKINRNMFHIGKDKLIQGRVYPQSSDGASSLYKTIREISQKVIAECLDVPNLWKNVKGTTECRRVIASYGTHYEDYSNFSSCNVSYLKYDGTEDVNMDRINVGHDPICPKCGYEHSFEEAIECDDCYSGGGTRYCYCCDERYDEDDMYYIDGEWYCSECSTYCEYHGEREAISTDEMYYIEDYGWICESAFEYGDFFYCDSCENYYERNGEEVETEYNIFCSRDCAEDSGFIEYEGTWYNEDDLYCCEECGTYVPDEEWDDEANCCKECSARLATENEEVA